MRNLSPRDLNLRIESFKKTMKSPEILMLHLREPKKLMLRFRNRLKRLKPSSQGITKKSKTSIITCSRSETEKLNAFLMKMHCSNSALTSSMMSKENPRANCTKSTCSRQRRLKQKLLKKRRNSLSKLRKNCRHVGVPQHATNTLIRSITRSTSAQLEL